MTRAAKQSAALFLIVAALGLLAWRLWPDGGRARQRQRNSELVRAVETNDLNAAIRLLNEGADPNAQAMPLSLLQKAEWDYEIMSRGKRLVTGAQMDDLKPPRSVLETAVINDKVSMVKALLAKGASVERRDTSGQTALGWAQILSGGSLLASGTHDQNVILALLRAAAARKKAP